MISTSRAFLGLLAALLVVGNSRSQATDDKIALSLPPQIELGRLVDLAAAITGLTIDYDPAVIKGDVAVRTATELSDSDLWDLLNRALESRGFTTVRGVVPNTYSVVKLSDAIGAARVEDRLIQEPFSPGFQTILYEAKHSPARSLVEPLTKIMGKSVGSASVLGNSSYVSISDTTPRLRDVLRVLTLLDRSGAQITTREVQLTNVTASQAQSALTQVVAKIAALSPERPLLGDVVPAAGGSSLLLIAASDQVTDWTQLIEQVDRREPVETIAYSPRYHLVTDVAPLIEQTAKVATDERWKLVIDEFTGSLLITATPRQHEAVHALLARLDDVPAAARRPVRTS